jgi:hypothetical protein
MRDTMLDPREWHASARRSRRSVNRGRFTPGRSMAPWFGQKRAALAAVIPSASEESCRTADCGQIPQSLRSFGMTQFVKSCGMTPLGTTHVDLTRRKV